MSKSLVQSVLTGSQVSVLSKCRCEEVHVFLYEGDSVCWAKGLPANIVARLTLHDCFHALLDADKAMEPLLAHSPTVGKPCAVVIDSLSSLLLRCSPAFLCRWVATQSHDCLAALLHSDLHTADVLAQLDYVATAKLTVSASMSGNQVVGYAGSVSTVLRKPSGKIQRQSQGYQVSRDCSTMETLEIHPIQATPTDRPPVDPAANLTFDLHLSAQEKAARSLVVLPYTSAQQDDTNQSAGEIFYEADEMDFDESDPDDDLDI